MQSIELKIENVKGLREDLCVVQSALRTYGYFFLAIEAQRTRLDRIQKLIDQLDIMRPLGPDGKHGNRHTLDCGCEFPDPTPEQEIDLIDQIIAGLPIRSVVPTAELYSFWCYREGVEAKAVELMDVVSAYPSTEVTWVRISNFDHYEVNTLSEVRNRFTRRTLKFMKDMPGKYVEMDDKDGYPHYVSVDHVLTQVFDG